MGLVDVTRGLQVSCTLHRINYYYLAEMSFSVILTLEDTYLVEILSVCAKVTVERFVHY